MIDQAINIVVEELNEFIKLKFNLSDNRVVLSNLVSQDGSMSVKDENMMVVSLVNIQQERLGTPKKTGVTLSGNPPVYMNLYLLISASFNEKLNVEALKFLSAVIGFFQSKSSFTPLNSPGIPPSIEKLIFNIYNTSFQEQSNLWSFVGAKYIPSVVYKVRMVVIDEGLTDVVATRITERDTDANAE